MARAITVSHLAGIDGFQCLESPTEAAGGNLRSFEHQKSNMAKQSNEKDVKTSFSMTVSGHLSHIFQILSAARVVTACEARLQLPRYHSLSIATTLSVVKRSNINQVHLTRLVDAECTST